MKTCSYCGKEYSDAAMKCIIDGEDLIGGDVPPPPPVALAVPLAESSRIDQNTPGLVYPEYHWTASDAWKCFGVILILEFVVGLAYLLFQWWTPGLYENACVRVARALFFYGLELMAAVYFARTRSWQAFLDGFGLGRKPSGYVWFGVLMALALRCFGHLMWISHLAPAGSVNLDLRRFIATSEPERYLYLVPLVLFAPLFEELVNRGFLYKALRATYSPAVATTLLVAWTAYKHAGQYRASWAAALELSVLAVVQCHLREKSQSLWDTIICHVVFNGSTFLFLRH